jgi:hypothetical protein
LQSLRVDQIGQTVVSFIVSSAAWPMMAYGLPNVSPHLGVIVALADDQVDWLAGCRERRS